MPLNIAPESDSPVSTALAYTSLSAGAKASIGIAAAASCLAFIAVVVYIFYYRRRATMPNSNRFEKPELATSANLTVGEKEELMKLSRLTGPSKTKHGGIQELDGNERYELEARRKQIETNPVELE